MEFYCTEVGNRVIESVKDSTRTFANAATLTIRYLAAEGVIAQVTGAVDGG